MGQIKLQIQWDNVGPPKKAQAISHVWMYYL